MTYELLVDYNTYRSVKSFNFRQRFLVIHYTAEDFSKSILGLTSTVSSHYLIPQSNDPSYPDEKLKVFNLVSEQDRAWHAGLSAWENRTNLNDSSIGIENVYIPVPDPAGGYDFPDWDSNQTQLLTALCRNIISRYPDITPTRVVGHSDIAYGRKLDPGPKFPWFELYKQGVGAWYEPGRKQILEKQFTKRLPEQGDLIKQFVRYGYQHPQNDQDVTNMVKAFQMHFRPQCYDGVIDMETVAILYALLERYKPA